MEKNPRTKVNKMFFIAVTISLLMILIACIAVYPQVIPNETNPIAEVTEETTLTEEYNEVDNIVNNVAKETTSEDTDVTTTNSENTEVEQVFKSSANTSPIMPIADGEIINDFSDGELVKSATSGIWQTHNGVDIGAEVGIPVQSVADGTVTKVYEDALLGICVSIDHTDFTANYCNLDKGVIVTEGESVTKGTILGTVGNTSVSESALDSHLHFEILQGDKYVDPLDIVK